MYKPSSRPSSEPAPTAGLQTGSLLGKRQTGNVALIAVILIVAVGLIAAGIFVWSRQDKKVDTNPTQENNAVVTPKTKEKTEDEAETITKVDLLLQRSGDEDLLPAVTPSTFVEYIKGRLNDFECDFSESPNGGFTISKISPRFVEGSIGCLGGASAVWYLTTAGWEEFGFQSMVPCSKLSELAIPSDFMAECYDDSSSGQETIANPNGKLNKD
jgi:hypothetical protein